MWKLSADIKVYPGSKYFKVIVCTDASFIFSSFASAVNKYQFLFCLEQLSTQNMKCLTSRLLRINLMYVLATSDADLPFTPLCRNMPVAFPPFLQPPTGANVSLNRTIRLQKTTTFSPGILGSIIFFCISTDAISSSSFNPRSLSFL